MTCMIRGCDGPSDNLLIITRGKDEDRLTITVSVCEMHYDTFGNTVIEVIAFSSDGIGLTGRVK